MIRVRYKWALGFFVWGCRLGSLGVLVVRCDFEWADRLRLSVSEKPAFDCSALAVPTVTDARRTFRVETGTMPAANATPTAGVWHGGFLM